MRAPKPLEPDARHATFPPCASQGVLAKAEDLERVFGTSDHKAICLVILQKGELQVSEGERKVELDALFRDVVSVLVEKCVNSQTGRPYTHTLLERALRDIHFAVDPTRPAKVQALQAVDRLREEMPIERARMRLQLDVPEACEGEARDLLSSVGAQTEHLGLADGSFRCTFLADPGCFRQMGTRLQEIAPGKGRLEVVAVSVQEADEVSAGAGPGRPGARGGGMGGGGPATRSRHARPARRPRLPRAHPRPAQAPPHASAAPRRRRGRRRAPFPPAGEGGGGRGGGGGGGGRVGHDACGREERGRVHDQRGGGGRGP